MHIVLEGEAEWILIYLFKKRVFLLLCSFREDVEVRLSIRLLCGLMGFKDEAIIIPIMCVIITKMAYLRRKSVELHKLPNSTYTENIFDVQFNSFTVVGNHGIEPWTS